MRQKVLVFILCLTCLTFTQVSYAQPVDQNAILSSIIKLTSPVEVAAVIKRLGIQYDPSLLNAPRQYDSDFKRALNLGIYSTDLGYANINEAGPGLLTYVSTVKNLAQSMGVGEYINTGRIIVLAGNRDNLNQLLDETTTTFEQMSAKLQERNQSVLAALMIAGGFIETLHITCEIAKKHSGEKEITDRVIEQQFILKDLITLLGSYQGDPNLDALNGDLQALYLMLSKYQLNHESDVKTSSEKIGDLEVVVIEDVNVSPDIVVSYNDLIAISDKVNQIRTIIIR